MLLYKPKLKPKSEPILTPEQKEKPEEKVEINKDLEHSVQASVFMTQTEINDNDIAGKLTYTNIYKSIPQDRVIKPIDNWRKTYTTEWRWRILKIKTKNENIKDVIEISYLKSNSNIRVYFNRYGQWVKRVIDPIFDQFVTEEYYAYSNGQSPLEYSIIKLDDVNMIDR